MAKLSDRVQDYYRLNRQDNFAASQRLEGIELPVTSSNAQRPVLSKEALRKKYSAKPG